MSGLCAALALSGLVTLAASAGTQPAPSGDPTAALRDALDGLPEHGTLYAVLRVGDDAEIDYDRLGVITLDGKSEGVWNGGRIIISEPQMSRYRVFDRRGRRVLEPVSDDPALVERAVPLSRFSRPLVLGYLLSLREGHRRVVEREKDEQTGEFVLRIAEAGLEETDIIELRLSAADPVRVNSVEAVLFGQRRGQMPVSLTEGNPTWMGYFTPTSEGVSVEVYYEPGPAEITREWFMQKEKQHKLRVSLNNIRYGDVVPLWDDPRMEQTPFRGAAAGSDSHEPPADAQGVEDAGAATTRSTPARRRGESPPPERFNDGWRPTEGDAVTPGVPAGNGLQRWLIIAAGGALVGVGVGFIVVRRVRG